MINDKLEIDLTLAGTPEALHEIFAAALKFPDFYEKNWEAFLDCITDPGLSSIPKKLVLKGLSHIDKEMPRDAQILRGCLADFKRKRPEITLVIFE